MNIAKNHVVTMHYTLKNGEGQLIDSSIGEEPLVYIQGMQNIIPGLENALDGKTKGDKVQAVIPPKEAYGERSEEMVQSIPKADFDDGEEITEGVQFEVDTPNGPMVLTAVKVTDKEVILDGNHPLAGMTLHFDVEITDIREATADEIAHGHVHGDGCNH